MCCKQSSTLNATSHAIHFTLSLRAKLRCKLNREPDPQLHCPTRRHRGNGRQNRHQCSMESDSAPAKEAAHEEDVCWNEPSPDAQHKGIQELAAKLPEFTVDTDPKVLLQAVTSIATVLPCALKQLSEDRGGSTDTQVKTAELERRLSNVSAELKELKSTSVIKATEASSRIDTHLATEAKLARDIKDMQTAMKMLNRTNIVLADFGRRSLNAGCDLGNHINDLAAELDPEKPEFVFSVSRDSVQEFL